MEGRTVFLFGKSMLLSLVADSLAENPNLVVIHEASWGEIEARAAECTPDVLIHDMDDTSECNILPMMSKNPRLVVIGLDIETNRAVLISGQETRSFTMDRIRAIVQGGEMEHSRPKTGETGSNTRPSDPAHSSRIIQWKGK